MRFINIRFIKLNNEHSPVFFYSMINPDQVEKERKKESKSNEARKRYYKELWSTLSIKLKLLSTQDFCSIHWLGAGVNIMAWEVNQG